MGANQRQKVVVVTGGSQGIGAGLVDAYRKLGYGVVATSRTITAAGDPDIVTVQGDIAAADTADRVVATALDRFGRIDTLVNNAGVFIAKPFTDYTHDEFNLLVGVNLAGFFQLTQRVLPHMLAAGAGHIVNITTSFVDQPNRNVPSVLASVTKGGLSSATKSLAIEYAARRAGRDLGALNGHTERVTAVVFSPDGRMLASAGGTDGTVRLWDIGGRRLLRILESNTADVESVVISPDGRKVVAAGLGHRIRIWESTGWSQVAELPTPSTVERLDISPDGRLLATANTDGTVTIWNLPERTIVATLTGHRSKLRAVASSPDGTLLASGVASTKR